MPEGALAIMADAPALLLALHQLTVSPVNAPNKRAADAWHGARINSAHHSVNEILLTRLLLRSSEAQIAAAVQSRVRSLREVERLGDVPAGELEVAAARRARRGRELHEREGRCHAAAAETASVSLS